MELINQIINNDCFNVMPNIPNESIDCIISDMPFNLTACSFDKQIIDLDKLWIEYKRITKPNGLCLSFGWNTNGIGIKRNFEIIEILLVVHGGSHNDTICVIERKK